MLGTFAEVSNFAAGMASRLGEFVRRKDEWSFQGDLATIELKQIDEQLAAAEIRQAIAENELRNHDQQIDNAREIDQFLRGKFTNQDLFQWMIGQVSSLYFQSYQLAYDLAKRAEMCLQHELGLPYGDTSFIQFGYWDSLKKGLLAGDRLSHDLKRLDVAYLDGNKREYELTKHVSLVSLAPEQFLSLKDTGSCEFDVPEWLFDLDTPGHYMRRLKMASLTIPCVTGPYTTIHCKLVLQKSSYRKDASGTAYERSPDDTRFIDDRRILDAIVTSTGQNDAGLFEPALRDERYLPFEGAGAISRWRLELPTEFQTFDHSTITDVVLHLLYTARSDDALSEKATASLKKLLADATARPLLRFLSLRHEFPGEWYRFVNSAAATTSPATFSVTIDATRFPFFVQGRNVKVEVARVFGTTTTGTPSQFAIAPGPATPADLTQTAWTGQFGFGPWSIATNADPSTVEDVCVVLAYTAN
jgi:hypothetical protein